MRTCLNVARIITVNSFPAKQRLEEANEDKYKGALIAVSILLALSVVALTIIVLLIIKGKKKLSSLFTYMKFPSRLIEYLVF